MASRIEPAFAVWVTGLPASGKSSLVRSLKAQLEAKGMDVAVLESDTLREIFTPNPSYSEQEREQFYRQIVFVGNLLTQHGVPVIFDATANRRAFRDQARRQIPHFVEVYVDCPLATCISRDPKGIYHQASAGASGTVPGLQSIYEPPERPELVVRGDDEDPEPAASRVVDLLAALGYLSL